MLRLSPGRWLLTLLIGLSCLLGASLAWAQPSEIGVSQMETSIMPEFDTPDILVLNQIVFKNLSNQPYEGELSWKVPKRPSKIIVAELNGSTQFDYTLKEGKDYEEIVWKLLEPLAPGQTLAVHIEYYYNNIQGSPDKSFTYDWVASYPIEQAKVYLLQPLKATNLKITPDFGSPIAGNNGFTYYQKAFSNLNPATKTTITVTYTKTDPNPSTLPPEHQQASGQEHGPDGQVSARTVILFLVGFALMLGLIVFKAMSNKQQGPSEDEDVDSVIR